MNTLDSFIFCVGQFDSLTIPYGIIISVLTLVILFLFSAFISASEVSFFGFTTREVDELNNSDSKRDGLVQQLKSSPDTLLATFLIAENIVNIAIVILSTYLVFSLFDFSKQIWFGLFVTMASVTFLLLLFGQYIPKMYAAKNPLKVARKTAPLINSLRKLFYPFTWLFVKPTNKAKLFEKKHSSHNISKNDLSQVFNLTSSEIKEDKDILEGIIKFSDIDAEKIIVPRVDVVGIDITTSFFDVIDLINETEYSRLPVYSETIDNIKGILFIKDLLPHLKKGNNFRWQTLVRAAYFVPKNKRINVLLEEFQKNKNHLAIVVDEFGGTAGIVTLEDILEEIVGDISDEYDDDPERMCIQIEESVFIFEAKILLHDFFKIEAIEEKDFEKIIGEADTLAGLILEIKGEIPQNGEVLTYNRYVFEIISADKRRIKTIKLTIKKEDAQDE